MGVLAPHHPAATNIDVQDPALVQIRDLIYRVSGIFQAENKFHLLANRCQRRMKVLGAGSFTEYLQHLTARADRHSELRSLLNEITVGETCFFRSQPQLDAITKIVLPKLTSASAKQACKKIRIWSAGCSSGEEPYTLSILMHETLAQSLTGWSFEIVATDLNDHSILKCHEGLYDEYSVHNLSPSMLDKYFQQEGSLYRVRDHLRAAVKFERLNLQEEARIVFMKGFDLIFCCNVLIYFDGPSKRRIVQHFYNGLLPGGYFFLGDCESLHGMSEPLRLVHFPCAIAYCKAPSGHSQ